jgi:dephospho-CoA kinase
VLKVALTGAIATGKSYVLGLLRQRGIPCLDADELAHGVMAPGTEATGAIAELFGDVLDENGAVDRRKLGPLVFADPGARRQLEAIVHPAVYRAIAAGLRAFELTERPPIVVVDIPLLYETGHQADFAKVIATTCSDATQLSRLEDRGLSPEAARQRLDSQLSAAEKASRADFVIDTDGSYEATRLQVDAILAELVTLASSRAPL